MTDSSPPSPAQRPDRMTSIRTRVALWSAMANDPTRPIENPSPMCLASAELAADVPALLADLDAAREALRRAEEERDDAILTLNNVRASLELVGANFDKAAAERDRMRPVVEAAREMVQHPASRAVLERLEDAVDAYEGETSKWDRYERGAICPAHGAQRCERCHRNPSTCAKADGRYSGCAWYAESGMHWDTCPNRVR